MSLSPPQQSAADRVWPTPPRAAPPLSISQSQARASVQWLASLALEKMPGKVAGDRDWGETKKIWSGVKIRRDGLKIKTHRRFRDVEHGRWIKYEVTLPDPRGPYAAIIDIHQVTRSVDPESGEQRWRIDSSIVTPMTYTARVQRWNFGLKAYSMTITGVIRVRLRSLASIGFIADYGEIPPALVIDPRIDQAQLILDSFEVDRISHIGGDVAEQWGEVIQEILVDRFVHRQNERLVGKLNRSIDKERDDLRMSMAQWLSKW